MRIFRSSDLQRNMADVQRAAMLEPVVLSYHEKPRFVLMTIEDYARLGGIMDTDRPVRKATS
ncbi:hypothetical protein RPMA_26835 [Tardiphaga alba]|uniref:Antitoxin n=1 Tax=Tardiphaga alba TaxID=340268 RepID=A0ABX8AE57_9BRAD|nr:hypothetical protein RPMA_26835 [Tardiphaga alba]